MTTSHAQIRAEWASTPRRRTRASSPAQKTCATVFQRSFTAFWRSFTPPIQSPMQRYAALRSVNCRFYYTSCSTPFPVPTRPSVSVTSVASCSKSGFPTPLFSLFAPVRKPDCRIRFCSTPLSVPTRPSLSVTSVISCKKIRVQDSLLLKIRALRQDSPIAVQLQFGAWSPHNGASTRMKIAANRTCLQLIAPNSLLYARARNLPPLNTPSQCDASV